MCYSRSICPNEARIERIEKKDSRGEEGGGHRGFDGSDRLENRIIYHKKFDISNVNKGLHFIRAGFFTKDGCGVLHKESQSGKNQPKERVHGTKEGIQGEIFPSLWANKPTGHKKT